MSVSFSAGAGLIIIGVFLFFLSVPGGAELVGELLGRPPLRSVWRKSTKSFLFFTGLFLIFIGLFIILQEANIPMSGVNETPMPVTETAQAFETLTPTSLIPNMSDTPVPTFTNLAPTETAALIPTITNQPTTIVGSVAPVPTVIISTPIKASQGNFVLADVLISPNENGTWLTLNGGSYGWGSVVVFEDDTTWVRPIAGATTGVYSGGYEMAKQASNSMFQNGCGLPDGCLHIYLRRVAQGKVFSQEIIDRPASTLSANSNKSESFPNSILRHVSLNSGELFVGTAVRFAIRAYGCNTMDIKENIPYTVFLLRGPLEVDVEIYNGGWDYWADIFDESFAKSLLEPKINEVKQHPNYAAVGHVECIIPPFK